MSLWLLIPLCIIGYFGLVVVIGKFLKGRTGTSTTTRLFTKISPGCFVPDGMAHRCNGRGCDCECHR